MAAAGLVIAAGAAARAAQDGPALLPIYRDAVRTYQATQSLDAARRLVGTWSRAEFETAVAAEAQAHDRDRLEAAAVFHLEIALGVAPAAPDGALLHVRLGERLLADGLRSADRGGPPAAGDPEFTARWFTTAASVFLAQTDMVRARSVVERGLAAAPNSAGLRLLAGIVEELEAMQYEPDLAQDAAGSQRRMLGDARIGMEAGARLAMAERALRHALALDPALVAARIHLGRVLFQRGHVDEARTLLTDAAAGARAIGDRVLAGLFLSDVHLRAGHAGPARAILEEVLASAPDQSTVWFALAQLEERTGHPDRARALVRDGLARPPATTDVWWDYRNGALNREGLAWLRARVRR